MKKLILSCFVFAVLFVAQAQDADKKVNIGLAYQFGLNFNKPGTNAITKDGAGVQNAIGLNLNINFNDNIGLATGLEFDFESVKYNFSTLNGNNYYFYNDKEIRQNTATTSTDKLFRISERDYHNIYTSIPVMLIFRTNPIGDFRYYGKFGARTSFLIKSSSEDEGYIFSTNSVADVEAANSTFTGTSEDNDGMRGKYGSDIVFFRAALGIAGGAQWNFTGNTMVFAELGYYYGLTPLHVSNNKKDDKMTLFNYDATSGANDYFRLKASQMQVCLKIGILF